LAEPRDSYARCLSHREFFDRFYERFLASHPEVPRFFENTDFAEQKRQLRHMLTSIVMYDGGDPLAELTLMRTARVHGPQGLRVPKDLYGHWLESLLETVRWADPRFDAAVEEAWRRVIWRAVDLILATAYADG